MSYKSYAKAKEMNGRAELGGYLEGVLSIWCAAIIYKQDKIGDTLVADETSPKKAFCKIRICFLTVETSLDTYLRASIH
jgi:hypothetical protein